MIENKVNRRKFLKHAASLGLLVYANPLSAKTLSSRAWGKIVIIGGGAAGISIADRLVRWLENPDILLIDPSDRQYYQPGFTMIASGVFLPEEVYKSQEDCIPKGVRWIKDEVVELDPVSQKAITAKSGIVEYDFLVLTPGLQINWKGVEGMDRNRLGEGNAHCIYDYQGAIKSWPAIKEFAKTGGKGIFTNTYTKLKCGGAPKKIALLTENHLRNVGNRQKAALSYFNASDKIFDTPFYATRIQEIFDERNIEVKPLHRLVGIDTQSKKAYFDKITKAKIETVDEKTGKKAFKEKTISDRVVADYDFMHFVPPMSAPDFVRNAGLGWTSGSLQKEAWAMVVKETLVHQTFNNIVCLGDVAGIPTSKTSAAARVQVPLAAKNLISLMEGKEPVEKYNGYTACPIITEYGKVLMAEFDYEKNPTPTIPFIDGSHEQYIYWLLKKYVLKHVYFTGMLNGWM